MNMENKNAISKFLKSRSLKYGSNSILLIVAVVVIAVLANVLIGMTDLKLDLTSNKLYTLGDVSKNMLKDVKQDVTITGLFDDGTVSGSDYKQLVDLLAKYQKYSHIKVRYIDPDKNPGLIKSLDPQGTMNLAKNDFVISSTINGKEKKKVLGYYDLFATQTDQQSFQTYTTGSNAEQGFTGAIKYVTSANTPVVYFTTGHNENDINSGYTTVKKFMDQNNFEVKTLNLATVGSVPSDAAMVIVASPKSDLNQGEEDTLTSYLKAGGNAIFMFDYLQNDPNLDKFNDLLSSYNVGVDYDKIKETDQNRHLPSDEYTVALDVSSNSIIPQAFNTVLSNSRSISVLKNKKDYITTTSLMQTANTAIGEMVSSSRGNNLKGPLDIAVAVENKGGAKESKLLVMGNASFISDNSQQTYGSYYQNDMIFFLQSLTWMIGEQQNDLNVPTKNYAVHQITITALQSGVVGGACVVVLPLIILGAGLFVFLRRRHL